LVVVSEKERGQWSVVIEKAEGIVFARFGLWGKGNVRGTNPADN
jgi:hypothetical protein